MVGTAAEKAGVLSFVLDGIRTEDVGGALDQEGIAVRSGHHCAQPILRRYGLESTVRASLAPYNTCEDIDALVAALVRLQAGRHVRRNLTPVRSRAVVFAKLRRQAADDAVALSGGRNPSGATLKHSASVILDG
jgi:hypothetical protein